MRLFQVIHKYGPYIRYFEKKYDISNSDKKYEVIKSALIKDRFYSPHILKPALNNETDGFYTMWNYSALQIKWAQERGWRETDLKKILFAQIEDFKPDVFYCCSPIYFGKNEIKKIGGSNMLKIAWFASPEKNNIDFTVYNTRLTNYPVDVKSKHESGYRSDLFQPSIDPEMVTLAKSDHRPVDIFFYGQYFPDNFKLRNQHIDRLLGLRETENWNIKIALQYDLYHKSFLPKVIPDRVRNSRFTSLFRTKKVVIFPSEDVRKNCTPPYYGIDLYKEISRSKIVFNAAVDFSGEYKVNMRNMESLGCAAHMISDDGIYPAGLDKLHDFSVYKSFDEFVEIARYFINNPDESRRIALHGHDTVCQNFSKEIQWLKFQEIVGTL